MLEYKQRNADFMFRLQDMYNKHYEEVPTAGVQRDMRINKEFYLKHEEENTLFCVTAEIGGAVVGYAVLIAFPMDHFEGSYLATCTAFYVSPEYRNMGIFKGMLEYITDACKQANVIMLTMTVNVENPDAKYPLESMGFSPLETVYKISLEE